MNTSSDIEQLIDEDTNNNNDTRYTPELNESDSENEIEDENIRVSAGKNESGEGSYPSEVYLVYIDEIVKLFQLCQKCGRLLKTLTRDIVAVPCPLLRSAKIITNMSGNRSLIFIRKQPLGNIHLASAMLLTGFLVAFSSSDTLKELRRTGELRKGCIKFGNAVQPSNRVDTSDRVRLLQMLMENRTVTRDQRLLDAYLIPSEDEHQSEFVENYDRRLQYISGFSGSYGDAIVTRERETPTRKINASAVLWTDGRYHLQADNQLDCGWKLMRQNFYYVPNISEWLHQDSPDGGVIGADPRLVAQSRWIELSRELRRIKWELVEIQTNLIDVLWISDREPRRNKNVFILGEQYAGQKWTTKVRHVRDQIQRKKADAMVVTALDEIAWLLNIRGRDVPSSPFVRSYVLLDMVRVRLYVNKSQLMANKVDQYFRKSNELVEIYDYDRICSDLASQSQTMKKILIPSQSGFSLGASRNITNCIPTHKRLFAQSPIILFKARKNPTEVRGMQRAHIRDAAAMCEFFAYFDQMFKDGKHFTELDVVRTIDQFRYEQENSLGNSFLTIAAYGSNGALPHYIPTQSTNVNITDSSTLVLDSGGQYLDGTTDVTRTLHFGTPTKEQKEAYTRVLIGQIQLASLTFPADLTTSAMDIIARAPLWEVGLDYDHDTGHGIGSFSSVHESPISLAFNRPSESLENDILRPRYFLSNEPGYYREGVFGVRLENIMEVIEKNWLRSTHGNNYLGFKTVTLVPYEPKLIDLSLLSIHQIRWLNQYNDKIRIHVGQELKRQNFTKGFYWMMERTNHFHENGQSSVKSNILVIFLLNVIAIWTFTNTNKVE